MQAFFSNGGFAKMMSTIIQSIFVLGIGALLFIEGYHNQPFNPYLLTFLGVILGHQATMFAGVQSQGDLLNALNAQSAPAAAITDNTNALNQKIAALQQNTSAIVDNTVATQHVNDPVATQPKLATVNGVPTNG